MSNVTFLKPKVDTFERYVPAVYAILQNDRLSYFEIKESLAGDKHFIEIFSVLDMLKQELYHLTCCFDPLKVNPIVDISIAKEDPSDAYPAVLIRLSFSSFVMVAKGIPFAGTLTREGYIKGKTPAPNVTMETPFKLSNAPLRMVANVLSYNAMINQGGWVVDSDRQVSYVVVEPCKTHVQILCLHLLDI